MKLSPLKICILGFPFLLWSYFFVSPERVSQKILIQKNIIGLKNSHESIFVTDIFLAEKLTTFFEPAPVELSNANTIKHIVPQKLSAITFNNFSIGILLKPLTVTDLQILNTSSVSQNFDLLISSTSQIPNKFLTKIPTVYANTRQPSDSLNEKFRLANQALIWAQSEILFDFSGDEMEIFK